MRRCTILGFAAVVVLLTARPADARRQTATSVDLLDSWVKAVNAHNPGKPNPSVGTVVAMTYAARRNLNTALSPFLRALRERDVVTARSHIDNRVARPVDRIAALARSVRGAPGVETFLKRAAVLHADAVVYAGRFPRAPDDAPAPIRNSMSGARSGGANQRVPPLLTNDRVTLTRDGEVLGEMAADWHLPFARSLLDELLHQDPPLPVPAADREFVGEWYHAMAAFLFATGKNGDATAHLQQAARVLPDDARLLFDRGSYAETFGLPIYQAVQYAASAKPNRFLARIPDEATTNAEAERLYRRALEVDAAHVEARVRLARLLERRGQHDEAAAQIAGALESRPSGAVGFYALIVAGRVDAARRRYADALRHYRAAARLYPGAQSALLGASHAALMLADVPGTLEPIEELGADGTAAEADPWLDYQLGAGRDVNALLPRLWLAIARPAG